MLQYTKHSLSIGLEHLRCAFVHAPEFRNIFYIQSFQDSIIMSTKLRVQQQSNAAQNSPSAGRDSNVFPLSMICLVAHERFVEHHLCY